MFVSPKQEFAIKSLHSKRKESATRSPRSWRKEFAIKNRHSTKKESDTRRHPLTTKESDSKSRRSKRKEFAIKSLPSMVRASAIESIASSRTWSSQSVSQFHYSQLIDFPNTHRHHQFVSIYVSIHTHPPTHTLSLCLCSSKLDYSLQYP